MALGHENRQGRIDDVMLLVGDQLPEGSIYGLLAEHGAALFGDEYFADLFKRSALGRPTVPGRIFGKLSFPHFNRHASGR